MGQHTSRFSVSFDANQWALLYCFSLAINSIRTLIYSINPTIMNKLLTTNNNNPTLFLCCCNLLFSCEEIRLQTGGDDVGEVGEWT